MIFAWFRMVAASLFKHGMPLRDAIAVGVIGIATGLLVLPIFQAAWPRANIFLGSEIFFIVIIGMPLGLWLGKILSVRWQGVYQFVKFAEVGFLNTFLDLDILNLLMVHTGQTTGWQFSLFKSISFLCALISSYFLNKYWTFDKRGPMMAEEAARFLAVSVLGLLANVSLASLVVDFVRPIAGLSGRLWADTGALAGIIGNMAVNFIGYHFWVFPNRRS